MASDAATMLAHERRVAELRSLLADGPRMFGDLAAELFEPGEDRRGSLNALVMAGSRITGSDRSPVLSARYHLFVRATEGAYTCLSKAGPHVSLGRRETCSTCSAAAFEFGACKRCGAVYLSGSVRPDEHGLVFGPPQQLSDRRLWLLLATVQSLLTKTMRSSKNPLRPSIRRTPCCAPRAAAFIKAQAHHVNVLCSGTLRLRCAGSIGQETVRRCLACGARGAAMVRRFESGGDAAVSVLSAALYQALPPSVEA